MNMICLKQQCRNHSLSCCACVEEYHSGHLTTTLKKLLIDANKVGND